MYMKIHWNKVTWYSKLLAVIIFVATFYVGFIFGNQNGKIIGLNFVLDNYQKNNLDTSFKVISPKTGDTWKIGETYLIKFKNIPNGSLIQGWLQNINEVSTGIANIGIVETGRNGNPISDVEVTIPSQWCGGECGPVQQVLPGRYRLLLKIYKNAHDQLEQTFYGEYFTLVE